MTGATGAGRPAQPSNKPPTIQASALARRKEAFMLVIVLEALLALAVLLAVVWWTMFAGRKKGELPPDFVDRKP